MKQQSSRIISRIISSYLSYHIFSILSYLSYLSKSLLITQQYFPILLTSGLQLGLGLPCPFLKIEKGALNLPFKM